MLSHYALQPRRGSARAAVGRRFPAPIPPRSTSRSTTGLRRRRRGTRRNAIHLRRELLLSDRLLERLTLTSYLAQADRILGRARDRAATSRTSSRCAGGGASTRGRYWRRLSTPTGIAFSVRGAGRTACWRARSGSPTPPTRSRATARAGGSHLERERRSQLEWEVERGRGATIRGDGRRPASTRSAAPAGRRRTATGAAAAPAGRASVGAFDATLSARWTTCARSTSRWTATG